MAEEKPVTITPAATTQTPPTDAAISPIVPAGAGPVAAAEPAPVAGAIAGEAGPAGSVEPVTVTSPAPVKVAEPATAAGAAPPAGVIPPAQVPAWLKKAQEVAGAAVQKAEAVAGEALKKAEAVGGEAMKKAEAIGGEALKKAEEVGGEAVKKAEEVGGAAVKKAEEVSGEDVKKVGAAGALLMAPVKAAPLGAEEIPKILTTGAVAVVPAVPTEAEKEQQKKRRLFDTVMGTFLSNLQKKETLAKKVVPEEGGKKLEGLTAEEKKKFLEAEKLYQQGLASIRDLISPSSMEIRYDSVRIEGMYAQTFYVFAYPRYLDTNWLAPVINFEVTMDISQFIYPIDSSTIMRVLRKKVAQMQSAIRIQQEKGNVRDPALETALEDAEELRTQIQRGQEKFFQFALYFTVYAESERKLMRIAKQLESLLGGKLVLTKRAQVQAEQGLNSCLPMCLDELEIARNMNTSPLSSTFPFSSVDLTSNEGILYGINRHNDSLIIFDRFKLENANSVVFAKSGAGKSYAVKLEILRLMMLGTDVIVIDPENEYEALSETVGGSYLRVSLTSDRRINPFDMPPVMEGEEVMPGDILRQNIITLNGLLKLMLGGLTAEEESVLDRALIDTYALKGITMDVPDPSKFEPPTMEDLHNVLSTMEGAQSLAQRLQKYTSGTYGGIFNKPTNVNLQSGLMAFSIRDLEDQLRPIAMYVILNFIWAKIRSELKKRVLVIDEAWTMMQHEDSAKFLFGLVKRARKYYLGVTTITQDVEDFVKSNFGKPIITNSSLQLLLKQAPAAIDILAQVFNLTQGEKYILLNSGVGQGLFFAGNRHVAIQIIASYTEDKIVTTNPEQLLAARKEAAI